MAKKLSLKLFLINLFLIPAIVLGQEWKKVKSLTVKFNPTAYSLDIQGNFYLGFQDGRVTKYDPSGKELQTYSLSNQSPVSLLEAQNSLKLFVFNFDNQKITYLDRFSSLPRTYFLSDLNVSIGMMGCPSPDGNLWVTENNPRRLKKIDPLRQVTIMEVQTSFGDSIKYMRTHKNLLMMTDETGFHVLDQFGSKEHYLEVSGANYFQIINDEVLLTTTNEIIFIDPFKGQVVKRYHTPSNTTKAVIRINDKYLVIGESIGFFLLEEKK